MPLVLALGAGLAGIATIAVLARRERSARTARQSQLFDACRGLFETSRVAAGPDGFPRLDAVLAGRPVRLVAIPDTLTLKRLPQLWLAVSVKGELPVTADLALLARANGAEFFAITQRLRVRLDLTAPLTGELLARGSHADAQAVLDRLATPLSMIFADPKVKEVAVTRQGLRLCYQASEGKRGEHLLLRQSAFPDGAMDPARVLAIVDQLLGLDAALRPEGSTHCPAPRSAALG